MALLRDLRLSGPTRDTAVDWDPAHQRWRVEVRWTRRIAWNWVDTPEKAAEQRMLAEQQRQT